MASVTFDQCFGLEKLCALYKLLYSVSLCVKSVCLHDYLEHNVGGQ